jgi:hypothetical protein
MHKGKWLVKSLTTVSTGAGSTIVALRPASGKLWRIHHAIGWQTDGTVVCAWLWIDPETPAGSSLTPDFTIGTGVVLPLGSLAADRLSPLTLPVWATYLSYPIYLFAASAITKSGFVKALVEEYASAVDI